MSETITFPKAYNGGPGFAQGGYLAGAMAELVGRPARTTFRAPTPLETPMSIEREEDTVRLVTPDGTMTVSAEPASVSVSVPNLPDRASILAARRTYSAFDNVPTDRALEDSCFVCSSLRHKPDGMELFASPVTPGELVADFWLPGDQYAEDGTVRDFFVWAALDCPAGFGAIEAMTDPYDMMFTGQLAGELLAPVYAGQEYIALGWPTGSDGRKHGAASAICDLEGNVKAVSESLWITTTAKS